MVKIIAECTTELRRVKALYANNAIRGVVGRIRNTMSAVLSLS